MLMFLILLVLAAVAHFAYSGYKLKKELHIFQLNSYRASRYGRWFRTKVKIAFVPFEMLMLLLGVFAMLFENVQWTLLVFIAVYLLLFFWRLSVGKKRTEKKPLVFTSRAKRLFSGTVLLLLIFYFFAGLALTIDWQYLRGILFVGLLLTCFSPFLLMFVAFLLLPLETAINNYYLRDAKKILESIPNLLVIGITGSFGKTSTKQILYELLREHFNTLVTPGSYNTPLGVCKVIRADLKPTHEIFIVEMSAKEPGDIKELCDFVHPRFGVLTAIGEQHLETFKNIITIKNTKNELIASLPKDGLAFFNLDNDGCRELAEKATVDSIYFGLDNSQKNLQYFADEVAVNDVGTTFVLHKEGGESVCLRSNLLGQHNIYNILAACAVASELGVKITALAKPIKLLRPVEHRLQLKKLASGVTVIDDAFNANPVGSQMALEVLAKIAGNKKIIVTPGMVELGIKEYEYNRQFGAAIAKVVDYSILVGAKQTEALQEGLREEHFAAEKLYVAKNFTDAQKHLQTIIAAGDVVLFENDLPDNYEE